jgi:hypothetical protein
MNKSIREHISFVKNALQKNEVNFNWRDLSDFNRTQIGFFQHERLIHLLVTLFFGFIFWSSAILELLLNNVGLLIINVILLITLIFYIFHYFSLENNVQKLYKLEDEIEKHFKK